MNRTNDVSNKALVTNSPRRSLDMRTAPSVFLFDFLSEAEALLYLAQHELRLVVENAIDVDETKTRRLVDDIRRALDSVASELERTTQSTATEGV